MIKNEQFQKSLSRTRAHFVEDEFKLDIVIYVSDFQKNADDSVSDNMMIFFLCEWVSLKNPEDNVSQELINKSSWNCSHYCCTAVDLFSSS